MTIKDEILIIANQLANDGKKPSVALVKTKLSSPAPLPLIISTLKNWQHQPDYIGLTKADNEPTSTKVSSNDDELKAMIEQALLPIKSELTELKKQLNQLLEQHAKK